MWRRAGIACNSRHAAAARPPASSAKRAASVHDWTRFGWDVGRSSASTDETGITAANVATLRRQQVTLDGTVDASPIYLHGVRVNGGTHDVFFVTTTYGKTLAIDADSGKHPLALHAEWIRLVGGIEANHEFDTGCGSQP